MRIHPSSFLISIDTTNPETYSNTNTLQSEYVALTDADGDTPWDNSTPFMFQPNYSFYGCCNDPTNGSTIVTTIPETAGDPDIGTIEVCDPSVDPTCFTSQDWDFSDLVCQPFKQARDASLRFLYNIDFLAGDRVGFVTFDRAAFPIDPDGAGHVRYDRAAFTRYSNTGPDGRCTCRTELPVL